MDFFDIYRVALCAMLVMKIFEAKKCYKEHMANLQKGLKYDPRSSDKSSLLKNSR
jgi:hypothetical protein